MTMTLTEELTVPQDNRRNAASSLASDWAGIRLSFSRMGTRKTLSKGQRQTAADPFNAEADSLSASKKLIDTKDGAVKKVTAVLGKARETWQAATLPYPEAGVRMIRRDRIDDLTATLAECREELTAAVDELEERYAILREDARQRLGDLFDPSDYPPHLTGLFTIDWDLPSLDVPEYLKGLNPKLYAEQSARIAARFDEAVSMAEDAFIGELAEMIETLQRKLSGLDDGTEKRLHASSIENLNEFFARFRSLNLHSSAELDKVVEQAESALNGRGLIGGAVTRDDLKDSAAVRREVATRLSAVSATLDGLMTISPRRAINRRKPAADATPDATPATDGPTE